MQIKLKLLKKDIGREMCFGRRQLKT